MVKFANNVANFLRIQLLGAESVVLRTSGVNSSRKRANSLRSV